MEKCNDGHDEFHNQESNTIKRNTLSYEIENAQKHSQWNSLLFQKGS